jgi:membrane-bound lytic murein transglycosylase D
MNKPTFNKQLTVYSISVAVFLTGALFLSSIEIDSIKTSLFSSGSGNRTLPQVIKSVNLDRPFDLAGEQLPMDNFDVVERLDREILSNAYMHGTTLLNIKAAYRYFPMFESVLAAYGVPDDFKYIAVAESNLRAATSPAGAKGIWQFMPNTAKGYGLELTEDIDERLHIEKATEAACKLILDYKKRFGSWTMAAAAYNLGETRLAKEIAAQHAELFFDLNLNSETSRYVFRIVAIKEIMANPESYGYYPEEFDKYKPLEDYKVVEVTSSIASLADFAKKNGTTYRMLKVYNPWLINSKLENKTGKLYRIKIPLA